jgi:hypothetical protein
MPYKLKSGFVYVERGGKWVKKNKSRLPPEKARAYLRALYAHLPAKEKK